MSEFTNNAEGRIARLSAYMNGMISGESGRDLVVKYEILTGHFTPGDILEMFDRIFHDDIDMEALKTASSKLFNVLYRTLMDYPAIEASEGSFIDCLQRDNQGTSELLKSMKPAIKALNQDVREKDLQILRKGFEDLQTFLLHYVVKENVLFPMIEKKWPASACLKLMWSIHDDIRRNIKQTLEVLHADVFDLKRFNELSSRVYFAVNTIIFREERILFPVMMETLDLTDMQDMLVQAAGIGLHFYSFKVEQEQIKKPDLSDHTIRFSTGELSVEQAELVFNHLPVDITFVDEADTVRYFSAPKHRIFPRTTGIIGRKVQDCHPHESVDVVTKIVESFRKGEKDVASFWIQMHGMFILIQYFAVFDAHKKYRGVLEVSQEISDIRSLEGEKRLLDWED